MNKNSPEELFKLAKKEKNVHHYRRLQSIAHFISGMNRTLVAKTMKVSRRSVNVWVSKYLNGGLVALERKPMNHRQSKLSEQQKKELCDFINNHAQSDKGGRLIGADVHAFIKEKFNVNYHSDHIYKVLKKLGFSWITSRSKHPKHSEEAQETFKKFSDTSV